MKEFILQTPATSANLGAGFDSLGLAVNLHNRFYFKLQPSQNNNQNELNFSFAFKNKNLVSQDYDFDIANNLLIQAYLYACEKLNQKPKSLDIVCENNIPDSSGLGSSTTAICAGIAACFVISGQALNEQAKKEILKLAFHFESHPDNLTPCLFGGFCIGAMNDDFSDLTLSRFELNHPNLKAILILPKNVRTSTNQSRKKLAQDFSLKQVIFNSSRTALLTHSLMSGDFSKLKIAMQDSIHQELRLSASNQKQNFDLLLKSLNNNPDFYGLCLSGSGPSLLVLASPNLKIDGLINQIYPQGAYCFDTSFDNQGISYISL